MRLAASLSLGAAALICVAASASALRHDLQFIDATYNIREDVTSFKYRVQASYSVAVEYFSIGRSNCSHLSLAPDQLWSDYDTDRFDRSFSGYKYDYQLDAGRSQDYFLVLRGKVSVGTVPFLIKDEHGYGIERTTGPDCRGDSSFPSIPTDRYPDRNASCTEDFIPPGKDLQRRIEGSCSHEFTVLNTFREVSRSGLISEWRQEIKVSDRGDPYFTPEFLALARDSVQECTAATLERFPPKPPSISVIARDDCAGDDVRVILPVPDITTPHGDKCPTKFVSYTWTAIDDCGNSRCLTQTVSLVDSRPPEFYCVDIHGKERQCDFEDKVLECEGIDETTIPAAPNVRVRDDCCIKSDTPQYSERTIKGGCSGEFAVIRTWNATDCCGNSISRSQTIKVIDRTPPEIFFRGLPDNLTYDCPGAVPRLSEIEVGAVDSCTPPKHTTINVTEQVTPGRCPNQYTLARTWAACDDCGNCARATKYFVVRDVKPPVLISDFKRECSAECGSVDRDCPKPWLDFVDQCDGQTNSSGNGNLRVDFSERTVSQSRCPNRYTLERRWIVRDRCDNNVTITQTVKVDDKTAPRFANESRALGPYQCAFQVPPQEHLFPDPRGDKCPEQYNITRDEKVIRSGNCGNTLTIVRTWTISDCVGNENDEYQVITVNDTTGPVVHIDGPSEISVACDSADLLQPNRAPKAFATDNCDCPANSTRPCDIQVERLKDQIFRRNCSGDFDLVRTWRAVDCAGNEGFAHQILHVIDRVPPRFVNPPSDLSLRCNDSVPLPTLYANDSCASELIKATPLKEQIICSSRGCNCGDQTIVQSWMACDDCGNCAVHNRTVYLRDDVAPELLNVPDDVVVRCPNKIPVAPDVTVRDNCDQRPVVTMNDTKIDGSCPSNFNISRVWCAEDKCGNKRCRTQLIQFIDTVAPAIDPPSVRDVEHQCDQSQPPTISPTCNDACGGCVLTNISTVEQGSCRHNYTLNARFLAVDECRNFAILSWRVRVFDTLPPIISPPRDTETQCEAPPPADPDVIDICDPRPSSSLRNERRINGTCRFNFTLVRQYSAQDACGNEARVDVKHRVVDTIPPEFDKPLKDVNSECRLPPPERPFAEDNCGGKVDVSLPRDDLTRQPKCPARGVYIRSWNLTDECGNRAKATQTISLYDDTAPILSGVPNDTRVSCRNVPARPLVTARDNCDDNVTVVFDERISNGSCLNQYNITRIWKACDRCDNCVVRSQLIEVDDRDAPFVVRRDDEYFECAPDRSYLAPNERDAVDSCPGRIDVDHDEKRLNESCPHRFDLRVTNTFSDQCRNKAVQSYTVHVDDRRPPKVTWDSGEPRDVKNLTCPFIRKRDNAPEPPSFNCTDNCGECAPVDYNATNNFDPRCPYRGSILRTWRFQDRCSNRLDFSQRLTYVHEQRPRIYAADTALPPRIRVIECIADQPVLQPPTILAEDACGEPIRAMMDIQEKQGRCPGERFITWSWNATDVCDLSEVFATTLYINDTQAPEFNKLPTDLRGDFARDFFCQEVPPAPVSATDKCDRDADVTQRNSTQIDSSCPYRFTQTYTWIARDRCGNSNSYQQRINYTWGAARPVFVDGDLPQDLYNIDCDNVPPAANLSAVDGCGRSVPVFFSNVTIPGRCRNTYSILRTWRACDRCGICTEHKQNISVVDNVPPVLKGVPAAVTKECGLVPTVASVCASDNCDGVSLYFNENTIRGRHQCDYKINRTWYAVDECGNRASATQIITIIDTRPPLLFDVPRDFTTSCPFDLDEYLDGLNVTAREAALESGWCISRKPTEDNCTDDRFKPITKSFTMQIGGRRRDFLWLSPPSVVISSRQGGFADIMGRVYDVSQEEFRLDVNIHLVSARNGTDPSLPRVPLELRPSCYDSYSGGSRPPIDPSTWTFYLNAEASFSGVSGSPSDGINVLDGGTSEPSRVGVGANGLNAGMGGYLHLKDAGEIRFGVVREEDCHLDQTQFPGLRSRGVIGVIVSNKTIPLCGEARRINLTYEACDNSTNCARATQVITVEDREAPIFFSRPKDVTINCTDKMPTDAPLAFDHCDRTVRPVEQAPEIINRTCNDTFTVRRTWYAADGCKNLAIAHQLVFVEDREAPRFVPDTLPPAFLRFRCNETIPKPCSDYRVRAEDNCDLEVRVKCDSVIDTRFQSACPASSALITTWTATDGCGNQRTFSQRMEVVDDVPPFFVDPPRRYIEVDCYSVPKHEDLLCLDDCNRGSIVPVFNEVFQEGRCNNTGIMERTWVCTDACNNTATFRQVLNITDSLPPVFQKPLPWNREVECDDLDGMRPQQVSATDLCDPRPAIDIRSRRFDIPGSRCPNNFGIEHRWIARDCTGQSAAIAVNITVNDTRPPTIKLFGVPNNRTVEASCRNVPPRAPVFANDTCSTVSVDVRESYVDRKCPNRYRLQRTYIARDECGNINADSYDVVVDDRRAPEFIEPNPPRLLRSCAARRTFQPNPVNATDDCTDRPEIQAFPPMDESNPSCPGNFTRVYKWQASDGCDNNATRFLYVDFYDNEAPEIDIAEFNTTDVCVHRPADSLDGRVTDNCDQRPYSYIDESPSRATCPNNYTITRIYNAVDHCNNKARRVQVIRVFDNQPPEFTSKLPPTFVHVDCPGDIPRTPALEWQDNCGIRGIAEAVDECPKLEGSSKCGSIVCRRTWDACDDCGNCRRHIQIVEVSDRQPPQFDGLPRNETRLQCGIDQPASGDYVVCQDDCSKCTADVSQRVLQGDCPGNYTLVRVWNGTDACGNIRTEVRTSTFHDTERPFFKQTYEDVRFASCDAVPAREADPTVGDHCDSKVSLFYRNFTTPSNQCRQRYTLNHEWTARDSCGNRAVTGYVVSVDDRSPPFFKSPPAEVVYYSCDNVGPRDWLIAGDTCDDRVNDRVQYREELKHGVNPQDPTQCDIYTISRYWTVRDECNNTVTVEQAAIVTDNEPPYFTSPRPADMTVECDQIPPRANVTAADKCSMATVVFGEWRQNGSCPNQYTLFRNWTAYDACGNMNTTVQRIDVIDSRPPALFGVPADEVLQCNSSSNFSAVRPPSTVCASDNCPRVNLHFHQSEQPLRRGCATRTLLRSWVATDACGLATYRDQKIEISDDDAPIITQDLPQNRVVEACRDRVDAPFKLSAQDQCSEFTSTANETVEGLPQCRNNRRHLQTFTIADACGNIRQHRRNVTVLDTTPPVQARQGPLCLLPVLYMETYNVSRASWPGYFFDVRDEYDCHDITLTITGCSSNQDSRFNMSYFGNFSEHCRYDSRNDRLELLLISDWSFSEGRIFTVSARACDECNNCRSVQRDIWVPADRERSLRYVPSRYPWSSDSYNSLGCVYTHPTCE